MAIAYRTTNGVSTGTSTGTSIAVTKPSGVQDGDILIVGMYHDDATMSTVPDGWTEIASVEQTNTSPHFWLRKYWKRASSEGASWTWVIGTSGWYAWECAAYTGGLASGDVLTGTPTTWAGTATSSTPTLASITTGYDGAMLVAMLGNYDGAAWGVGSSPLTNERADANGICLDDGIQATAGASGAKTWTQLGYWSAGIMCALRPALTGATLEVADSTHAHTAEAPVLTQAHSLAVADSGHVHTADNVTLQTASLTAEQIGSNIRLTWTF